MRSVLNISWIIIALLLCARCTWIYAEIDAEIGLDVEGNGFHRTLIYRVDFKNLTNNCQVAIYMELPSALYVNVDEVADLRRRGTSTVCSTGETDVELFMEKAGRQNVTTCASLSRTKNHQSWSILTIPVHQRYQYAHETGGYANVTLPMPKLLLGCQERIKEYRVSKTDLCEPCVDLATKWREIPYRMLSSRDYIWPIPVGNKSVSLFVTCITLSATVIGAIFIGYAMRTSIRAKED
ncbi:hypothetical protein DMN91_009936 [Ooceraea biroi]|uniref:Phosphatidylinositol-glycan biosynthesis class X protein n=1 Tax=Ooceraea biroi TaxID=2015173 RepID=A0A026W3C6_OOCBI|nr:uncharacterized protein LOC105283758 [Ooceraea biroi]EZA50528.1 Phosphatidylinositol-glycan biosynthesis class X protein [Ooceraea biroi]RLU17700.1 hypothetical protein DMN91_009936 [Ooceraea biroi]